MLTPADIKHRSLKTTMGGYNKKDTESSAYCTYYTVSFLLYLKIRDAFACKKLK